MKKDSGVTRFIKSVLTTFSTSDLPSGSQNKDNFERNINPGGLLSENTVLSISAVWACVRLLAETMSTLPIFVYKTNADGSRDIDKKHFAYPLLHSSPNADMTAQSFIEAYVVSAILNGKGYSKKNFAADGKRVISLDFIPFSKCSPTKQIDGSFKYRVVYTNGKADVLLEDQMFNMTGFSTDGRTGLSAVKYGARVFNMARQSDSIAGTFFEKGMFKTVGFKLPGILKKDQRKEIKEDFRKEMAGAMNVGSPFILEGGMEAMELGINPVDMQLLESRAYSVEEICRWFRVPPIMIGHSEKTSSWPTSTEAQGMLFLTYALRPWLTRFEQAAAKNLLGADRADHIVEFAIEGLLRADSTTRKDFYASALQNGWMNRATVAKLENLPIPPGGDIYTVQSNLLPIEKLGETTNANELKSALKNFLQSDEAKP